MTADPIPVSVLVQTRNEEPSIGRCIDSLKSFDEIIVVDSDSTDRTKEIAESHGAQVVNFSWNGKYPKKKQWQFENVKTKNDWILFIDADESPTPELIEEIRDRIDSLETRGVVAVDIPLRYVFSGKELRHGHRVVKRALVRKGHVSFPVVDDLGAPGMGELEGHYQPSAVDGTTCRFAGKIFHHDTDPVSTWFDRHNRYSDWEAYLRVNPNSRFAVSRLRTRQGQLFDRVPLKPLFFFIYCFFVRRGFLDGRSGLDYALALSFYYWQIGVKTRERARRADGSL